MAKKIEQYRYYGDKESKNQPESLDLTQLENINGGIVFNYPVLQLGIQTLPGTMFYLNGNKNPVIIGSTGIFEIDLEGLVEILKISFNTQSLDIINSNPNGYLIIDVLYEGED